jgi:polyisoprenoid-binding protein YceI
MTTATHTDTRQTLAPAGRWTVDPRHSAVEFAVKHLVIATIKGRFREFEGSLEVQPVTGKVHGHGFVKVESIDTAEPSRDGHLLSPDFFDVDRFPEITFGLSEVEPVEDSRYRVHGEIRIRGVRRKIALDAVVSDTARDPWGNERLAVDLTGSLSRKDFHLRWNQVVDAGPVAGDEVRLSLSLSLVQQADY